MQEAQLDMIESMTQTYWELEYMIPLVISNHMFSILYVNAIMCSMYRFVSSQSDVKILIVYLGVRFDALTIQVDLIYFATILIWIICQIINTEPGAYIIFSRFRSQLKSQLFLFQEYRSCLNCQQSENSGGDTCDRSIRQE